MIQKTKHFPKVALCIANSDYEASPKEVIILHHVQFTIVHVLSCKLRKLSYYINKSLGMHTHIKDVPDIARTSPTFSVVKFKPPNLLGLTAHNEKTY